MKLNFLFIVIENGQLTARLSKFQIEMAGKMGVALHVLLHY